MRIKINTKKIATLNPCKDRLDNWLTHYKNFNDDIVAFLDLENITYSDKLWVALRLLPRVIVETFAFDCAIEAQKYASATYAVYHATSVAAVNAAYHATYVAAAYAADAAAAAADAAAAAANAAAYKVAKEKAQQGQIEALIYLIQNHKAV